MLEHVFVLEPHDLGGVVARKGRGRHEIAETADEREQGRDGDLVPGVEEHQQKRHAHDAGGPVGADRAEAGHDGADGYVQEHGPKAQAGDHDPAPGAGEGQNLDEHAHAHELRKDRDGGVHGLEAPLPGVEPPTGEGGHHRANKEDEGRAQLGHELRQGPRQHQQHGEEQDRDIELEAVLLAHLHVEVLLELLDVQVFAVFEPQEEDGEDGAGDGDEKQRSFKADVGHVHAPGDQHGGDVHRRGRHAHDGAYGQDRPGPGLGDADLQQDRGHDGAGGQDRGGGGAGDHAREHGDEHEQDQHQGRDLIKLRDDQRVQRFESAGALDGHHEQHGRGDDEDGVDIGEAPLEEMPHRDALPGHQRAADGAQDHGQADGELEDQVPQQKYAQHDQQDQ